MFSGHTCALKLEWLQLVVEFVCFVAYVVGFQCKSILSFFFTKEKYSHNATSLE